MRSVGLSYKESVKKFLRGRPNSGDKGIKHDSYKFFLQNLKVIKNIFLIVRQYVSCKKSSESTVTRKAITRKNEIRGS